MLELRKDLEADDPYAFVAVRFPVDPGVDPDEQMARCFIEEYALLGWPRERVRRLFDFETFSGTHDILRRRGPAFVDALVADVFGPQRELEVR